MALRVNGVGVTLAEYNTQRGQIVAAAAAAEAAGVDGKTPGDDEIDAMLQAYFVENELLAQVARQSGFQLSDTDYDTRLQTLIEKSGGQEAFQNWLAATGSNADTFALSFRREIAAQWQREQIAATVGETAEQIHARQILVTGEDTANQILSQLRGGMDFAALAEAYDSVVKGDLGWFPRGYLFLPEVEDLIFALQPGQYTNVIESEYGYYIIMVEDREPDRPLSENARLKLQHQALNDWLTQAKDSADIEIYLP